MTEDTLIIIKKYPNRRLYNTNSSSYINLDTLFELVKKKVNFAVKDAKTGKDLTKNILIQIIFEQEAKGYDMLPEGFLRQIIMFYDNKITPILPKYLESSINIFVDNYQQMKDMSMQPSNIVEICEDITKQNIKLFENTFNMFYKNITNK